jgi:multisubunit Na+/H+ antiporter MnhC subunit
MNGGNLQLFWLFAIFVIMLFIIGLYCMIITINLIRALIGLELLIKAVTLLIITTGYITGQIALTQSLVITLIVIEVVVMTVAVGIVLGIYRHTGSLDSRSIRKLKG